MQGAEKLEVQVMEMIKTKLGADNPDTLANLASTFRNQSRREEAEKSESFIRIWPGPLSKSASRSINAR